MTIDPRSETPEPVSTPGRVRPADPGPRARGRRWQRSESVADGAPDGLPSRRSRTPGGEPPRAARPRRLTPSTSTALTREGDEGRRVSGPGSAHAGGVRELPQAGRPRGRGRAGARRGQARAGAAAGGRQPRPRARPRRRGAGGRDGDGQLRVGDQARATDVLAALKRAGIEPFSPEGERVRPAVPRGRRAAAGRGRRSPARWSRSTSAATGWARACCGRRASSSPGRGERRWLTGPTTTRSSASARTPPRRRSRRPTASSRASTTRTATRATSRPRSASRRSRRPTTCCPMPTSARPMTAAPARSAASTCRAGSIRARSAAASATSSQPVRRRRRRRRTQGGGPRRRAGRARRAGRDLETEVSLSFDQAVNGAQVPLAVPTSQPCPTCDGSGAKPGTAPQGLPGLQRPRRGVPEPGHLLDVPAVLELPRLGHGDRGTLPDLRRHRRPAHGPPAAGQHPRRRARRQPYPARRQGRAGAARRRARRPVRDHARADSPVFKRNGENLEVEVPLTIPEALQGAVIEVPTLNGSKRLRVPPGPSTAPSSACAARARQRLGGKGRGDIHYRFVIDVPASLSPEQSEAVDRLSQVMNGDPRARLFAGWRRRRDKERRLMARATASTTTRVRGLLRPRRVHDLGRRRARRDAPADAAHVRGARADRAEALAEGNAAVLA